MSLYKKTQKDIDMIYEHFGVTEEKIIKASKRGFSYNLTEDPLEIIDSRKKRVGSVDIFLNNVSSQKEYDLCLVRECINELRPDLPMNIVNMLSRTALSRNTGLLKVIKREFNLPEKPPR